MHRYFQINEEQLKYLIEADIRRFKFKDTESNNEY